MSGTSRVAHRCQGFPGVSCTLLPNVTRVTPRLHKLALDATWREEPERIPAVKRLSITKGDGALVIHASMGMSKTEAADVVIGAFDEIAKTRERSEGVKLAGFGTFPLRRKKRAARKKPKDGKSCLCLHGRW